MKVEMLQINKARNELLNIIKELMLRSDKFNVSPANFNTLVKANLTLGRFPAQTINGYIDISANTHLKDGGLDYSSFTIGEDYFEIYNGFISYKGGECDDSSWERVFSTNDTEYTETLSKRLTLWAEMFLLHLETESKRSLLIIDRSTLIK